MGTIMVTGWLARLIDRFQQWLRPLVATLLSPQGHTEEEISQH
jgi:hypothetical protein